MEKPKDKFYLMAFICFYMGIGHYIPTVFFNNATSYWMLKFRNTSSNIIDDPDHRTPLQTQFQASYTIAAAIPLLPVSILAIIFGHYLSLRVKILFPLILILAVFIFHVTFVYADTDSWQFTFFILVLLTTFLFNGSLVFITIGCFAFLSYFPPLYLSLFLIGDCVAGVLAITLQIISLSISGSVLESAFLYFLMGFVIIFVLIICYILSKKLEFSIYHTNLYVEKELQNRRILSFREFRKTVWILKYNFLAITILLLTKNLTHNPIGALVVSEFKGDGSAWSEKYFVPVSTFLMIYIGDLTGRITFTFLRNTPFKGPYLVLVTTIYSIVTITLFMFSNAKPRHLPVLLIHDYQYILFVFCESFVRGFLHNISYIEIKRMCPDGKVELGFQIVVLILSITISFSFLSAVLVYLL